MTVLCLLYFLLYIYITARAVLRTFTARRKESCDFASIGKFVFAITVDSQSRNESGMSTSPASSYPARWIWAPNRPCCINTVVRTSFFSSGLLTLGLDRFFAWAVFDWCCFHSSVFAQLSQLIVSQRRGSICVGQIQLPPFGVILFALPVVEAVGHVIVGFIYGWRAIFPSFTDHLPGTGFICRC